MNLLQIINDLKQIAAKCDKVTSGNVSHKIANIEQGILNITYYLEHYCELGWHPASELPPKDGKYIVISLPDMYGDTDVFYAEYRQLYGWCYEIEGHYTKINIQKWCYPPKEE